MQPCILVLSGGLWRRVVPVVATSSEALEGAVYLQNRADPGQIDPHTPTSQNHKVSLTAPLSPLLMVVQRSDQKTTSVQLSPPQHQLQHSCSPSLGAVTSLYIVFAFPQNK